MDELAAAMESGELLEALRREPLSVGSLLLDWALYRGDADRAAELAEVLPGSRVLEPLARLYARRGERQLAANLALRAFLEDPGDRALLDEVLELAPVEALEALESERDVEIGETDVVLARVRLLRRIGRTGPARDLLLRLFDQSLDHHCTNYPEAEALMADLAPDVYEARVRLRPGDPRLIPFLIEAGRLAEAGEELDAALARAPGEARLWDDLGELHRARGEEWAAVAAWLHARELGSTRHTDALARLAPDRLLELERTEAIAAGDDDGWGRYGDLSWRAGRIEAATEAWRRARQLDPRDWDWIDRLEKLAVGVPPLEEDERVESLAGWLGNPLRR